MDQKLIQRHLADSDDTQIEGFKHLSDASIAAGTWYDGEDGFAAYVGTITTPGGKIIACRKMIHILRNAQLRGSQNQLDAQKLARLYADLVKDQTDTASIWARTILWGLISGGLFLGSVSAGAFYTGSLPVGALGGLVPAAVGIGVGYGVIAHEPADTAAAISANVQRIKPQNRDAKPEFDHLGEPPAETPTNWPRLRAFWNTVKPYVALCVPAIVFAIGFASLFFFPLSFVSKVGDWLSWLIAGAATAGTLAVQYYSSQKSDTLRAISEDMESLGELCGVRKIPLEQALGFTPQMGLSDDDKIILAKHILNNKLGKISVPKGDPNRDKLIEIINKIIANGTVFPPENGRKLVAYLGNKDELDISTLLTEKGCTGDQQADKEGDRWITREQQQRLQKLNQPWLLQKYGDAKLAAREVQGTGTEKSTAFLMALIGAALAAAALFCVLSSFFAAPSVFLFTTLDMTATSGGFFAAIVGTFAGTGWLIYDDAKKDINQKAKSANEKMRESIEGGANEIQVESGCIKDAWYKRLGLALFSYKTIGTFLSSLALIANPFTGIPTAVIAIIAALLMLSNILGQSIISSTQAERDHQAVELAAYRKQEGVQVDRDAKLEHNEGRDLVWVANEEENSDSSHLVVSASMSAASDFNASATQHTQGISCGAEEGVQQRRKHQSEPPEGPRMVPVA